MGVRELIKQIPEGRIYQARESGRRSKSLIRKCDWQGGQYARAEKASRRRGERGNGGQSKQNPRGPCRKFDFYCESNGELLLGFEQSSVMVVAMLRLDNNGSKVEIGRPVKRLLV